MLSNSLTHQQQSNWGGGVSYFIVEQIKANHSYVGQMMQGVSQVLLSVVIPQKGCGTTDVETTIKLTLHPVPDHKSSSKVKQEVMGA